MAHLLSVADLSVETLGRLVTRGVAIARGEWAGRRPLEGKTIGIYFRKSSTRTRTSFHVGALKLGATVVAYGPNDLQTTTGETPADTARVLSEYLDALVIRTNEADEEMREMARQPRMPIINAMSENEHPTQVIGDLISLAEQFDRLKGLHILYLGEGNNTAASLALAVAMAGDMRLTLLTPEGFGLKPAILERALRFAAESGSVIETSHDLGRLPRTVDAVYTTRWETMGVVHSDPNWRERFKPYRVTTDLMRKVSKPGHTVFLHDLPAIRGAEVVDAVLDGPQSIAFRQAHHKLTSAMVVLDWCLGQE